VLAEKLKGLLGDLLGDDRGEPDRGFSLKFCSNSFLTLFLRASNLDVL